MNAVAIISLLAVGLLGILGCAIYLFIQGDYTLTTILALSEVCLCLGISLKDK